MALADHLKASGPRIDRLTLILDGIARLHETGWRSGSRERG